MTADVVQIHEAYDHPVTAAMKRMRALVLNHAPLLMRSGANVYHRELPNESIRQHVAERYAAGASMSDLCREFDLDESTVRRYARARGLRRRQLITPAKRAAIRAAAGTRSEIARRFSVSKSLVSKIKNEHS